MKESKQQKAERKQKEKIGVAKPKPKPEESELLKKLDGEVKKIKKDVNEQEESIQASLGKYMVFIDTKVKDQNKMQDYDMEFQINQKFSNLWNAINSDKFAYLKPEDKESLDRNLHELSNKLTEIEMKQQYQRQFLVLFYEIIKNTNQSFKKKEYKDEYTQTSAMEGDNSDLDKFEKAEEEFM